MNELYLTMIFGALGGITRAFVGLLKYAWKTKKRGEGFSIAELLFTIIASGFIGLFCGLLIATNYALSLLAGYAGTDLIEGIYKIKMRKKVIM